MKTKNKKIKIELDKQELKKALKKLTYFAGVFIFIGIIIQATKYFLIPIAKSIFNLIVLVIGLYFQLDVTAQFFGGIIFIYALYFILKNLVFGLWELFKVSLKLSEEVVKK